MDSDFTTGNKTVDRMSRINITGNIIPAAWYKTIRKSTGKPYLNAIVILSDIVYWYRAAEIRDEGSGQLIGFRKRFHSDLLQRSYQQLADQFGISKRDANNAIVELEKLGVIKRVFRTLCINGQQVPNVLFLDLDVDILPVYFILDEFPNIGVVPDFKKKLATARSRQIGMCILYQNIPQLQNRYPDGQWEEILGGCDTSLFLGCNDMTTATYFSDRSGEITVGVSSIRKSYQTMRMTDYVPDYSESASVGKRMLLLPDEVLRFPLDQALLIIRGQKVLRVKKIDYTRHPEAKYLKPEKTGVHVPEWWEQAEKNAKEREQAEDSRRKPQSSAWGEGKEDAEEEPLQLHTVFHDRGEGKKNGNDPKDQEGGRGRIEKVEDLFQ